MIFVSFIEAFINAKNKHCFCAAVLNTLSLFFRCSIKTLHLYIKIYNFSLLFLFFLSYALINALEIVRICLHTFQCSVVRCVKLNLCISYYWPLEPLSLLFLLAIVNENSPAEVQVQYAYYLDEHRLLYSPLFARFPKYLPETLRKCRSSVVLSFGRSEFCLSAPWG